MNLFQKIHKLSTYVAVFSGFIASVIIFLYAVDMVLRLDFVSVEFEEFFFLIAALSGILFGVSTILSVALSLFYMSQKK